MRSANAILRAHRRPPSDADRRGRQPAGVGRGGRLGGILEREDPSPHKSDGHQYAKQERPRPQSDTIVERVAEEDHDAEHERQVERGDEQACHGEAAQGHARPSARDEGDEDNTGHDPAERDESKQVSLERIGKAADPIVDSEAREPRHVSRARADPVQREIARHHAAVDAQRHQPDRHDVVHDDIGAEDDGDVFMRERQEQQRKKLRKPRKVVVEKMQQG